MRLTLPLIRAIDWVPLLVASAVVLVLTAIASPNPGTLLLMLRMSAVLLGTAGAFALVDPMAVSTVGLPCPRWIRQWLRTLLALAAIGLAWCAAVTIAAARTTSALALSSVTAEAAVLAAVGLAGAAVAVRRLPGSIAAFAGLICQLSLVAGTQFLHGDASPWLAVGDTRWAAIHRVWAVALFVPAAALAWANTDVVRYRRVRSASRSEQ